MLFTRLADWLDRRLVRRATAWRPASDLGRRGEDAAADFLRSAGLAIVERNYVGPSGEIDLVARDGDRLVFVEVKSQAKDDPPPERRVNRAKRRRIVSTARTYLKRLRRRPGDPVPPHRFDVVAVILPPGGTPTIRHHRGAF